MSLSAGAHYLDEVADTLEMAAGFIGRPFTADSEQVKSIIPNALYIAQQKGAVKDDIWRFLKQLKDRKVDGAHGLVNEDARTAIVTVLMQGLTVPVRCLPVRNTCMASCTC